jgi:antibiotic biosynthesis monooxygenase (ABM) superfamily enzyme
MSTRRDEGVTVVVTRRVKAGREADYEAWLARLLDDVKEMPGYLGVSVQRPAESGPREYTCVYRFEGVESLRAFEDSPQRRKALAEVGDYVESDATWRKLTGLELWFTAPPGTVTPAPSRFRMAVVMVVVVYAFVLVLGPLVAMVMPGARFELRLFVAIAVEVMLMTYVVMPRLTRWLARWIYPKA